jgi:hypothetical protein
LRQRDLRGRNARGERGASDAALAELIEKEKDRNLGQLPIVWPKFEKKN